VYCTARLQARCAGGGVEADQAENARALERRGTEPLADSQRSKVNGARKRGERRNFLRRCWHPAADMSAIKQG
jgi:hypothetical protein